MRIVRNSSEEQTKARAEEIKSNSLAPGKAQYSVSEVDAIIRNFKDSYVSLFRDVHLVVVTESTSKIRQGIEQGYIDAGMITKEMLDELEKFKNEASKVPGLNQRIQDDSVKIDELNDAIGNYKAETITLQNEITDLQTALAGKDEKIEELGKRAPTGAVDQSVIEDRDQVIMEKDRMVHQLTLEKNNLQSEFNRLKIERDAMAKHVEEMEAKLRSLSSEAASKEDKLFDDLQKQLDGSRQTNFNLRNQVAEHEDTIRNQKIDIQQKANQIESLKEQITSIQEQSVGKAEDTEQIGALRQQLNQRDTDMERLAETMVELQQDISSKEQEAHTLRTQSDELMLQLAEKETEMKEIRDMAEKATIDKESLEQVLLDKDESIEDLRAKLDETNKELNASRNTLEIMEKQGTMSSEEKYQYELNVQKLQKKIDQTKKTLKSVEAFLNTDPKYRVLYILNDIQRPLVKEEIAKILNISQEIASKYIFELDYFGYIKQNIIDGKNLIESTALLTPPLTFEEPIKEESSKE